MVVGGWWVVAVVGVAGQLPERSMSRADGLYEAAALAEDRAVVAETTHNDEAASALRDLIDVLIWTARSAE